MERSVKSKTRLSSVANACRVLRASTVDEFELGISELAKRLALAKNTAHRPAQHMTMKTMHLFAPHAIETGQAISRRLGHVGPPSAMNT